MIITIEHSGGSHHTCSNHYNCDDNAGNSDRHKANIVEDEEVARDAAAADPTHEEDWIGFGATDARKVQPQLHAQRNSQPPQQPRHSHHNDATHADIDSNKHINTHTVSGDGARQMAIGGFMAQTSQPYARVLPTQGSDIKILRQIRVLGRKSPGQPTARSICSIPSDDGLVAMTARTFVASGGWGEFCGSGAPHPPIPRQMAPRSFAFWPTSGEGLCMAGRWEPEVYQNSSRARHKRSQQEGGPAVRSKVFALSCLESRPAVRGSNGAWNVVFPSGCPKKGVTARRSPH